MIDFPASPTDGQIFSASNGVVYKYSAAYTSWLAQNAAPAIGGTGEVEAVGGTATNLNGYNPINSFTIASGNSGGWFTPATGIYKPPAGKYFIQCTFAFQAPSSSNGTWALLPYKNGVAIPGTGANGSGSALFSIPITQGVYVDANGTDTFQFMANVQAASGTMQPQGGSFTAFPLTGVQGPTGPAGVTQTVFFETGAVATGTTIIPYDDTIPQITEGDQYMTLAITPRLATSRLLIEVVFIGASSVTNNLIIALFQDATANALAATTTTMPTGTSLVTGSLRHVMTSGTTSSTTFRVRAGGNNAGTTTFNGNSGNRNFGGVLASSIVITEVP